MGTRSIPVSYPAFAGGEARLQRATPAVQVPAGGATTKVVLSRVEIINQPNPLDTVAQSYQGGAVVTLDFTSEVERAKAARSTCPTTT